MPPAGGCWPACRCPSGGWSWPPSRRPCWRAVTGRRWCCCTGPASSPGCGCGSVPAWAPGTGWAARALPGRAPGPRVLPPALPGHGASAAPPGPLGAERLLAWLGELVERTCPTPPTLVGRGLGGALAARFAAAHGHRLARLVLGGALGVAPLAPGPSVGE